MSELERIINELKGKKVAGIYKITSPSGRVYVGSSVNLRTRFNTYKRLCCDRQKKLYASFIKFGVNNHQFEILEFIQDVNENKLNELLNDREIYWGKIYDVTSVENLNLRLGNRNAVVSQEARDKLGKTLGQKILQFDLEGNFIREWDSASEAGRFYGISPSKITAVCKGRTKSSCSYVWRHKDKNKFIEPSYTNKNKTKEKCQATGDKNKIPIIQYSLKGDFIREWPSTTDASRELGIGRSNISSVLYKVNKKAGGFMWGYVGEDVPTYSKYDFTVCTSKRVIQFTKSGEFMKEWYSLSEAARELKLNLGDMSCCCRGIKCKTVGGFIWKYSESVNPKPPKKEKKGGCKKPVLQYSLKGEFMKEWPSVKEAAEGVGGKHSTGIVDCCKGINKSSLGFIWKYKKDVLP